MKIICIGRNFADHAKELANEQPIEPVIFLKPDTSLLRNNDPFFIPDFSDNIQYEVEIVVKINRLGKNIQPKFARKYYNEIGLGIDFTARDLQFVLKDKGLPWEKAKGFDGSAQISNNFIEKCNLDISNISFSLEKNGQQVQLGKSSEMIFKFDEIISYISKFISLKND